MILTPDMHVLLDLFERHEVKYMLTGGYAVNYYGYMRSTQDIDFLIYPSRANAILTMRALREFGFGGAGIPIEIFEKEGGVVHLGVEPNRIDLLTSLQGVNNDDLFLGLKRIQIEGKELYIIGRDDLIHAKRISKRLKDNADAEELSKRRP